MGKTIQFPQHEYIVTVQELHEKRYLVSNAVAPQQAQEWVEIYIEDDLSDLLEENIQELGSNFVTEGRNNIAESLRDIKVETAIEYEQRKADNNTEWIKNNNLGCTCGYDEEETRYHEQETCCPDEKCDCNSN